MASHLRKPEFSYSVMYSGDAKVQGTNGAEWLLVAQWVPKLLRYLRTAENRVRLLLLLQLRGLRSQHWVRWHVVLSTVTRLSEVSLTHISKNSDMCFNGKNSRYFNDESISHDTPVTERTDCESEGQIRFSATASVIFREPISHITTQVQEAVSLGRKRSMF
jgi:hypothetical protein